MEAVEFQDEECLIAIAMGFAFECLDFVVRQKMLAAHHGLEEYHCMSTVQEIESAVNGLSRTELTSFRDWFLGFDAEAWDKQFEEDVAAGGLDALADEAIRDLREGRCTDL